MRIEVIARGPGERRAARGVRAFALRLARALPASGRSEVTILLTGDGAVRRLNRSFRRKDATTDVLSFPETGETLADGTRPLGAIAVSVPQAARQARAAGHALATEVRLLVLHGYLHLLGYDHEVDDGTMMRLQARLARALLPTHRR